VAIKCLGDICEKHEGAKFLLGTLPFRANISCKLKQNEVVNCIDKLHNYVDHSDDTCPANKENVDKVVYRLAQEYYIGGNLVPGQDKNMTRKLLEFRGLCKEHGELIQFYKDKERNSGSGISADIKKVMEDVGKAADSFEGHVYNVMCAMERLMSAFENDSELKLELQKQESLCKSGCITRENLKLLSSVDKLILIFGHDSYNDSHIKNFCNAVEPLITIDDCLTLMCTTNFFHVVAQPGHPGIHCEFILIFDSLNKRNCLK